MRIACIHVPQLSLQCATRSDPSLRGAPVIVVGVVGTGEPRLADRAGTPAVVACSRAAWALGVRVGMTATGARAVAPAVQIVTGDPASEREAVRAIADAVLGAAAAVDLGGRVGAGGAHLAMYAEVPAKVRGAAFGERVLDLLDEQGFTARVGIADDRFTAWVAAAHGADPSGAERSVVSVPRGGSAAFLAPRPLALLAISPEVQHMLEALGVRTLGEFAALPAPTAARPLDADYQALARGEAGSALRPYAPEAPISEAIAVTAGNGLELADLLPLHERPTGPGGLTAPAAIALLAQRIARRLAGRGRLAARLEVMELGAAAREVPVGRSGRLDAPTDDAEQLARALVPVLELAPSAPWRLRVTVVGEALPGEEGEARPSPLASLAVQSAAEPSRAAEPAVTMDTLAVVLATPGTLFTLAAPTLQAERRGGYRRTRRGKHRAGRGLAVRAARASPQVQLFDRR